MARSPKTLQGPTRSAPRNRRTPPSRECKPLLAHGVFDSGEASPSGSRFIGVARRHYSLADAFKDDRVMQAAGQSACGPQQPLVCWFAVQIVLDFVAHLTAFLPRLPEMPAFDLVTQIKDPPLRALSGAYGIVVLRQVSKPIRHSVRICFNPKRLLLPHVSQSGWKCIRLQ